MDQVGKLMKGWQGLGYDGPYIGEGQAWGLAPKNHGDGEDQVDAWIRWIDETMKVYMYICVHYLWIKKEMSDMDEEWNFDHMIQ